jgi:hypothetical protein
MVCVLSSCFALACKSDGGATGSGSGGSTLTGGGAGSGGATGGSGAVGTGGNTKQDAGPDSQVLTGPPALSDDPTGITTLPGCALAQSGKCVRALSRTKQEVCSRWDADRATKAQSVWVAPSATCDPGTTPIDAQEDALRRINYARWLSGLDPVSVDPTWSSLASACSIIQVYLVADTGDISHYPPQTSRCYTEAGGAAAGQSQLAEGCDSAAECIDAFFWDNGDRNLHIVGHRKGLTAPGLRKVGIGFSAPAIGAAACVRTLDGTPTTWPAGLAGLVAYPAFDHTPYEMVSRDEQFFLPDTPLEWSIALDPSTDLGTPKLRLYRQDSASYESVVMDSGKTPNTQVGGLWLIPAPDPLPPATYVVLVEGTSLPAFGYRVAGYGCYGIEPSKCRPAGTIAARQPCVLTQRGGECVPGSDCRPNLDGTGAFSCQPYCDPVSTTAANACAKLCPKSFGEIYSSVGMERIGAFCTPATSP